MKPFLGEGCDVCDSRVCHRYGLMTVSFVKEMIRTSEQREYYRSASFGNLDCIAFVGEMFAEFQLAGADARCRLEVRVRTDHSCLCLFLTGQESRGLSLA